MCVCALLSVLLVLCLPAAQTYFLPDHRDEGYETKAQILAQIDVSMGGRVAEEMLLGPDNVTTGAGSDMAQATELARRFCMVYSMSSLGLSSFAKSEPSPETRAVIDREVEAILSVRVACAHAHFLH
jgi:ATP-dependent metalloprotease